MTPTRILVDPRVYRPFNLGDLAMCQVAIGRLAARFPGATIEVFVRDPDHAAMYAPARPIGTAGRSDWLYGVATQPLVRLLPDALGRRLVDAERRVRRRHPRAARAVLHAGRRALRRRDHPGGDFVRSIADCGLLVVTGGGLLTDAFERGAEAVLDELELALSFGVPVAMVGQGFGPLESPRLKRRAREVLPRLGLIASREGRVGPALLRSLGVDPSCVVVTGDDAVELSYGLRAQRPAAKGLGVSLRVAGYSDLDDGDLERVGSVLRAVAARLGTGLVPLPTSSHPGELDIASIQRALSTETETSFPASPAEAAAAVGRCRVVVTGSYHVAVFALAQGIPAVCLAKSDYYDWKHRGLAHLFGRGCDVVHLRSGALEDELAARVEAAWSSAEEVREPLLAAARRQIEAGREAYDRLPGLLSR